MRITDEQNEMLDELPLSFEQAAAYRKANGKAEGSLPESFRLQGQAGF